MMTVKEAQDTYKCSATTAKKIIKAVGHDREQRKSEYTKLSDPLLVAEYLQIGYKGMKQEEVRVLVLDIKNNLIGDVKVTLGTLTSSQVHPREVFRPAISLAGARIILAHNHPSGDPTPSKQDIEITKKVYDAGEIVGIPLIDHVIIGGAEHESLRRLGHVG